MSKELATNASEGLVSLPAIQEMAASYKLSAKAFAFTFRNIAMPTPHTEAEFVSCCLVALEHGLNPLTKEIYFMRDKHGKIQAIVGVDGWIKKCNEHPKFDGIEFEDTLDDKGNVTSIKARIFRKDRSKPTEVTEYLSECRQVRDKKGPWDSHPNRMLRHKALIQCSRIAFGFAGIMDRDEFDQWQSMRDVTPSRPETPTKPALLDIPDIPDAAPETVAATTGSSPVDHEPDDTQIADVEGFLRKLEDDIHICEDDDELTDIRLSNADIIKRLPKGARKRAEELVGPVE